MLAKVLAMISIYWTLVAVFQAESAPTSNRYLIEFQNSISNLPKVKFKQNAYTQIALAINSSLDLLFPSPNIKVIAEPGRFFVESAFIFVTRAHSKRKEYKNGVVDKIMYYVNDGIYGSFHAHANDRDPSKPIVLSKVNK